MFVIHPPVITPCDYKVVFNNLRVVYIIQNLAGVTIHMFDYGLKASSIFMLR